MTSNCMYSNEEDNEVIELVAKGFNQMAPPASITLALDMSKDLETINIHALIRNLLQTNIPGTITFNTKL